MPSATIPGSTSANTSPIKKKDRESTMPRDGTVRLFYSLKENPNAIISYSELLRQEQRRQRLATTKHLTTTTSPLKISKTTGTHTNQSSGPSSTAMDVDPPEGEKAEGEEALGEGDSEAEDEDDDEDDDENENEDDAEAEDEDDDEDPDDDEDDDGPGTEPRSFLDTLAEKYVEENGNEGEDEDDEDEDDDGEPRVKKKSSRWDHEYYDIEDDFIDDSEAMAESIGMVRPKFDGFFVYRGPVETTNEDPGAGSRSRRSSKRKPTAGASPLGTGKSIISRVKSSNLAVAESANDSTSEMSEMEDKPNAMATTPSTTFTAATEGSTSTAAGGESGSKKKGTPSKAKKLIYRNVLPQWIEDLEAQKAKYISMFTTRASMVWKQSGLSSHVDAEGDTPMEEEGRTRKFPWTQDLRLLLWEVMEKFMEILAAKSELHSIDDTLPVPPSESKTRKDAYQMLLPAFPPNWMTSYEISRQYSQLKEKVQKQERRESESAATASASKTGTARVPASALRSNVSPSVEALAKHTISKPTPSPSVPAATTGAPSTSAQRPELTASSSATVEAEGISTDHTRTPTPLDPLAAANKKRKVAEPGSGPAGSNLNDPITIDETPSQKPSQGSPETTVYLGGQGPPLTGSTAEYPHTTIRKTENQVSSLYSSPYPSSDPLKKKKIALPITTNKTSAGAPTSPGVTSATPTGAYRRSPVMGHPNYSGQPVSPVMHPSSSTAPLSRPSHPSYQHSYTNSSQHSRQQHYSQPSAGHHRLPPSPEMSFSSGPKNGGASQGPGRDSAGGGPTHEASMRSSYMPYSSRPNYQGPMLLYQDILTGDELFSDAFPMKVVGGVIEIDCQLIQVKQGADVDIGANASAEEADEVLEDGVNTVNNVVYSFRLQSSSFDKKSYGVYLKGYMKAVKAKISEAAIKDGKDSKDVEAIVKAFETSATAEAKKILGAFKDYEFYIGESMNPDGAVMLLNYREDGVTPYFTVFKDGLKTIKLTFIPELWYSFDDEQTAAGRQAFDECLEGLGWLAPALWNYGYHIRHLTTHLTRTVEILAADPSICQDLAFAAVPRMWWSKLPATFTRRSTRGWATVPDAWPQKHQRRHPRRDPDEVDLDEMTKAVITDPRFGDEVFQLSGRWLTDSDEAEFLHVQMLWLLLLQSRSTLQRLEISDSAQLAVAPFKNTATLAGVLAELPVLRHLTLPWPTRGTAGGFTKTRESESFLPTSPETVVP
ncbi:hypothetical protein BGZ52_009102 [Haplosporangium bisporale]|nr:hypothetical protein BGZ52_009102 [Haplosporangium bisporale]